VVVVDIGLGGHLERPGVAAQQSLTTKAIRTSCDSLATTSKDSIDKVNAFVALFNAGRSTVPAEGPAIDALNNSASTVSSSINDAISQQLKDSFNAYIDAAARGGQRHRHARADGGVQPPGRSTERHQDKSAETVPGCLLRWQCRPRLGLCDDNAQRTACGRLERGFTVVAADHASSFARKLGIQRDQVVQEWGWDEDTATTSAPQSRTRPW